MEECRVVFSKAAINKKEKMKSGCKKLIVMVEVRFNLEGEVKGLNEKNSYPRLLVCDARCYFEKMKC